VASSNVSRELDVGDVTSCEIVAVMEASAPAPGT